MRYKLNTKAPLTFKSAELTGHTVIIVLFLESMQETVQVKIKSSNLVELLWKYQFLKSGHLEVSRFAFGRWGHGIRDILEIISNIAKKLWIFPSNISCNLWLKFQPIRRWLSWRHLLS